MTFDFVANCEIVELLLFDDALLHFLGPQQDSFVGRAQLADGDVFAEERVGEAELQELARDVVQSRVQVLNWLARLAEGQVFLALVHAQLVPEEQRTVHSTRPQEKDFHDERVLP